MQMKAYTNNYADSRDLGPKELRPAAETPLREIPPQANLYGLSPVAILITIDVVVHKYLLGQTI